MLEAILANPVVIVDYDPSWPVTFAQLRDRLAATLGPLALAIEHVGSTAVPGLAAKPIIDLDVVIADRADLPAVIQRLAPLGYQPEGDLGVPGREAFTTPAGAPPHHLYVCAVGTPALDRHLAFRDALRANPALANAYGDLKRTLAARLRHDRTAYTEAKSAFVERAVVEASLPSAGPRWGRDRAVNDRNAWDNHEVAPGIICPAQQLSPTVHRRPRSLADSLSHRGMQPRLAYGMDACGGRPRPAGPLSAC